MNAAPGSPSILGAADAALADAVAAAPVLAATPAAVLAELCRAAAEQLEARGPELIAAADAEAHLGVPRFTNELARTANQFRLFAAVVADGSWADPRIDTGPPAQRRMLVPLGPVVVFGASNFPLAFSVPGGDTASALAAGCPVVVKAHPAHPRTSALAAEALAAAVAAVGLPAGTFAVVSPPDGVDELAFGQALVTDDRVEAVAFTGSLRGGRALHDLTAARPRPIPFYGELGSVNPVVVLPGAAAQRGAALAEELAASVTNAVGQFCTNPGLIFCPSDEFAELLVDAMAPRPAATMLTPGIAAAYADGVARLASTEGVELRAGAAAPGQPAVVGVDLDVWRAQPQLHEEVFGPVTVAVRYDAPSELVGALGAIDGQLSATVMVDESSPDDVAAAAPLLATLARRAGRVVVNAVPTGLAVGHATQHGGPYPASTDSRSTSVGAAAITRFARPVAYQDVPDALLPPLLQDANPLGVARLVDGVRTR